jgi:hypothetical protein
MPVSFLIYFSPIFFESAVVAPMAHREQVYLEPS